MADASPLKMKQDVEAEAGHLLEVHCTDAARAVDVLHNKGFLQATLFGRTVHVLSLKPDADTPRILETLRNAGLTEATLRPRSLTMEDVFVYRVTSLEAKEQNASAAATTAPATTPKAAV